MHTNFQELAQIITSIVEIIESIPLHEQNDLIHFWVGKSALSDDTTSLCHRIVVKKAS